MQLLAIETAFLKLEKEKKIYIEFSLILKKKKKKGNKKKTFRTKV